MPTDEQLENDADLQKALDEQVAGAIGDIHLSLAIAKQFYEEHDYKAMIAQLNTVSIGTQGLAAALQHLVPQEPRKPASFSVSVSTNCPIR